MYVRTNWFIIVLNYKYLYKGGIYMIIYKATINGKSYIGRTIGSLEERIKQHLKESKRNKKWYFYRAIHKYGKDSVQWEILEDDINDFKYLKERETFNILKYDTFKPNGYNMTLGGEGMFGYKASDKTKKKLSEYAKNRPKEVQDKITQSLRGRKLSEEHKKKLGLISIGRKWNNESKKKLSNALKGRKFSKEHKEKLSSVMIGHKRCVGRILSEETKEKIRQSRLGKKASKETKEKMSQSHSGEKNGFFGKHHTKEVKEKLSQIKRKIYENGN